MRIYLEERSVKSKTMYRTEQIGTMQRQVEAELANGNATRRVHKAAEITRQSFYLRDACSKNSPP